jgi:hypothetical protein
MKAKQIFLLALPALFALHSAFSTAEAQGTAFTYQGRLNSSGSPANGLFDFEFSLYTNAAGSGSQLGGTLTNTGVGVTNGLFVTTLDFGNIFAGNPIWLAMSVRSNGVGSYTPLTPLQELTPTPYATYAPNAGSVAASNITGTIVNSSLPTSPSFSGTVTGNSFSGNGANLTSLNASALSTGTVADARLSANVALLNKAQTFSGADIFASNVTLTLNNGAVLSAQGSATGGIFSPMSLFQNNSTAANASPALRVVGNGNTPSGVLSVSSQGTGLIAQFGNANVFVSQLDTNGNWTANSFSGVGSGLTGVNASTLGGSDLSAVNGQSGLGVGTNIYLNNNVTYLRSDMNHGLAYNGQGITNFPSAAVQPDGPVLWGFTGGALGVLNGGPKAALSWNNSSVSVPNALNVGGTATANSFSGNGSGLTNIPASQLTGTVAATINNTTTNPVPVISVQPNQPYVDQMIGSLAADSSDLTMSNMTGNGLTVPAGKRLVIENVSGYVAGNGGNVSYQIALATDINTYTFYYPFNFSPVSGFLLPSFNQPVKLNADPGTTISCLAYSSANVTGSVLIYVTLVGYYINDP